ncbi:MAG: RAMP superfamily CRISPR-associated protein [Desulfobacterales bacterium]
MGFDFFAANNSDYRPQLESINNINSDITELKKHKLPFKNEIAEQKKLWNQIVCTSQFRYSQWKALSACYFEEKNKKSKIDADVLKRYTELGSAKIKIDIEYCQSNTLLEMFKAPKINKLDIFPPYSFFLTFAFTLAKPFISRDDEVFYICENPVKKDKIFKVPMISGSSWKGNMRWSVGKQLEIDNDISRKLKKRMWLLRLFGNENESEKIYKAVLNETNKKGLRKGRLNFYSTFFDSIRLEVINPHNRKTKAGTLPIYIESVPEGTKGIFSLLYVPFDLMGRPEIEIRAQAANDLCMVAQGLNDMFTLYGFGAKTNSGYGVAEETFRDDGRLSVKANDLSEKAKIEMPVKPKEPKIVQKFRKSYSDEDFSKNINAWAQAHNTSSKKKCKKYREAKQAYQGYLKLIERYQTEKKNAETEPVQLTTDRTFISFPELIEKVSDLASCWRQSDE